MGKVRTKGTFTVGVLARRQFRNALDELNFRYADTGHLTITYTEQKGWLDSTFLIKLEGEESIVCGVVDWLKDPYEEG